MQDGFYKCQFEIKATTKDLNEKKKSSEDFLEENF